MQLRKSFLWLFLFTAAGISLHELAHHLLGIPSLVSLSRNWPQVAVTAENRGPAIIGTVAGPAVNLLLGYCGFVVYRLSAHRAAKAAGLYAGIANLFLVLSGAIINLIADWVSGSWANDLQQVSVLLGWPVLILPTLFVASAVPGFRSLYTCLPTTERRWYVGGSAIAGAWLLAGLALMLLDTVFHIRFSLRG